MKRANLIRSIAQAGFVLTRYGSQPDGCRNPVTGVSQPAPRQREIKEPLARRMIRLLLDGSADSSSSDHGLSAEQCNTQPTLASVSRRLRT